VQHNLHRLSGPLRQAVRGNESPAGFFEGVVVALGFAAGIFRTGPGVKSAESSAVSNARRIRLVAASCTDSAAASSRRQSG
jgi:hypothetical protein